MVDTLSATFLNSVKLMMEGDRLEVPMVDESGSIIYRIEYMYVVFEIPQYGGTPRFSAVKDTAQQVVDLINSWT